MRRDILREIAACGAALVALVLVIGAFRGEQAAAAATSVRRLAGDRWSGARERLIACNEMLASNPNACAGVDAQAAPLCCRRSPAADVAAATALELFGLLRALQSMTPEQLAEALPGDVVKVPSKPGRAKGAKQAPSVELRPHAPWTDADCDARHAAGPARALCVTLGREQVRARLADALGVAGARSTVSLLLALGPTGVVSHDGLLVFLEDIRFDLRPETLAIFDLVFGEIRRAAAPPVEATSPSSGFRQALADLSRALTAPLLAKTAATLVFLGLAAALLIGLLYAFLQADLAGRRVRRWAFLLAMPTFAVGALLGLLPFDVFRNPWVARACALLCATLASGIAFEVLQVLLGAVDREGRKSYMIGLRSLGVRAGGDGRPLRALLRYFRATIGHVLGGRARFRQSGQPVAIEPFFFRAVEFEGLPLLRRRLPCLIDGMLVVGIMFNLDDMIAWYYLHLPDGVHHLIQGTLGVLALSLAFRVAGTVAHHRLFT